MKARSRKVRHTAPPLSYPAYLSKSCLLKGQEVGSEGANAEPYFLSPLLTRVNC
jgi:hypothetical protein